MRQKCLSSMTPEEFEELIRRAVREELNEAGLRLDGADHQYEARADFMFLRKLRQSVNGASSKIGATVLVALVSGLLWLIWYGLQAVLPNR